MRGKIAQYPLSIVLTIIASVFALLLLFLFVVGLIAGLFVEMLKVNRRRVVYSKLKPTEYKIPKPIMEDNQNGKTKKIFKLPLPESIQDERMVYVREKLR